MSQLLSMRAALTSLIGALVLSLSCFIRLIWSEEEEEEVPTLNLLRKRAYPHWVLANLREIEVGISVA